MVTQAPPAPGTEVQTPAPIEAPEQPLAPPVDAAAPDVPPIEAAPQIKTPLPSPTGTVDKEVQLQARELDVAYNQEKQALALQKQQYKASLEARGYAQEDVEATVKEVFGPREQAIDAQAQAIARGIYVKSVAAQYRVPIRELEGITVPAYVEKHAQMTRRLMDAEARAVRAEAQVKRLTTPPAGGQTPVYMGGATPAAGSDYIQKLKSGGPLPSANEIDRVTARYLK